MCEVIFFLSINSIPLNSRGVRFFLPKLEMWLKNKLFLGTGETVKKIKL